MGAYTTINGTVHNITKEEFTDFLTGRYHTMATLSDNHMNGFDVNLLPFESAFTLNERADGIEICNYTSAKFMSYEDAMRTVPSFFVITDACRQLGDAELVVHPYQDEVNDTADMNLYRGESFPQKSRRIQKRDKSIYEPLRKFIWYFTEYIGEKQDDGMVTIPGEFFTGLRYVYSMIPNLFQSMSAPDHRVFADTLLLWNWCRINNACTDLEKLSVGEFCAFAQWMETKHGFDGFLAPCALTRDEVNGFRSVFEACGNTVLKEYCARAQAVIAKADAWEREVERSRYKVIGPDYTWREDGPVAKATVYKTYGWGFRVFEDISLDVRIDRSGITPASDPKELAEDITEMVFPIFCTVCGYEVKEDDVREAMLMPDEKAAYEALVSAVRRARFNNGLARVLPGYFSGEKMYRNRAALVASVYVRENMMAELNVPFDEKDKAKAVGAIWDEDRKKWLIARSKLNECRKEWIPAKYL